MTVQVSALGRTRIAAEAAFAVDESGTPANFLDLPIVESSGTFVPLTEHLEPQLQQQFLHSFTNSKMVLAKKSSTLALQTYLAGTAAPNPGNATFANPTTNWALGRLLGVLMGAVQQGTPQAAVTTVQAGSTTTSVNVTAGHGNTLGSPGNAYAVVLPNGLIEAREILSVTANAVVPKVAHSTAPQAGAAVYWATTFGLTNNTAGLLSTLQFLIEGQEAGDEYVGLGMQGTLAIDIAQGQIAKLSANLTGASWARTSSLTLAASTITNFSPIAHMTSELIVGTGTITASQTRNLVSHSSSTWTPGFANLPVMSPEGPANSGIIGFKRARGRAITGQVQVYDDAATNWITADTNRTDLSLFQQIGMTTSGIVLLSAPTVQLSVVPPRTPANDLYGFLVSWAGRNDEAISSPSTDVQRSAFRIHIF
jgi:hypothetical protein